MRDPVRLDGSGDRWVAGVVMVLDKLVGGIARRLERRVDLYVEVPRLTLGADGQHVDFGTDLKILEQLFLGYNAIRQ